MSPRRAGGWRQSRFSPGERYRAGSKAHPWERGCPARKCAAGPPWEPSTDREPAPAVAQGTSGRFARAGRLQPSFPRRRESTRAEAVGELPCKRGRPARKSAPHRPHRHTDSWAMSHDLPRHGVHHHSVRQPSRRAFPRQRDRGRPSRPLGTPAGAGPRGGPLAALARARGRCRGPCGAARGGVRGRRRHGSRLGRSAAFTFRKHRLLTVCAAPRSAAGSRPRPSTPGPPRSGRRRRLRRRASGPP